MLLLALTLDVLQDLRAGWILFIGLAAFEIAAFFAAVFDATRSARP